MAALTSLEQIVLAAIAEDNREIGLALSDLVASTSVTERKNTGHGFYTTLEIGRHHAPLQQAPDSVTGPNLDVRVGDQVLMMGFLLWLKDGYPFCLEGFQYGTRAGDHIDLRERELSALVSLGRFPPTQLVQ